MTTKVRVLVRVRPTNEYSAHNFVFNEDSDSIDLRRTSQGEKDGVNHQQDKWHFKINKLLVNASQETVFEAAALDVIASVLEGYNGTLMCYGQTGAGKTFTLTGGAAFTHRGIIPRTISHMFAEVLNRPEQAVTIRVSYIEIYNELMFDLLSGTSITEQSGEALIIREDAKGQMVTKGLKIRTAATDEELLNIYFEGNQFRRVADHALNKNSSRSHTVFTLYFESRSRLDSSEKVTFSKLHLVDLAGSERLKKTGSEGIIFKEATYINKSLTFLEQVVIALGDAHRDHVPYRQAKLTHLLKDSLGGNCKTTVICNIWPEEVHLEETSGTLRFATRMMRVSNDPKVNIHLDAERLLRKYERDLKMLKQELAMHDTLAGRGRVQYDDFTPDEQRQLEGQVKQYLDGGMQELDVPSLRMVHESFAVFRKLYQQLQQELASRPTLPSSAQTDVKPDAADLPVQLEPKDGEVGEEQQNTEGFSLGVAASGSRPVIDVPEEDSPGSPSSPTSPDGATLSRFRFRDGDEVPDRQAVYNDWKKSEKENVKPFEEAFAQHKTDLKGKKEDVKKTLEIVNETSRTLQLKKDQLARKRAERPDDEAANQGIIDEEEYALLKDVKNMKTQYRVEFENHRRLRAECIQIEQQIRVNKQQLVHAFELWCEKKFGGGGAVDEDDARDAEELYDELETKRLESQHPDALPYFHAKKSALRNVRSKNLPHKSRR
eukprot:GEMP01022200.1.p1 GENE.GEMP01022200.1~~GEMP01022200.1.p1  ORF type:complete len:717 (+),score=173.24 GEMP01022200.1:125-2275(+)